MAENKRALMLASVASMIDQFNIPNIRLLQSLGYTVDVSADFSNPGNITVERAQKLRKELEAEGVTVFDTPIPRSLSPKQITEAYRQIKQQADNEHYRLVHCHSPIGGALTRMAFRKYRKMGTKVIYTAHGFHFYKGAPFKNWLIFYPVERVLSRFTDILITINKEDYNRAKTTFHAKETIYVPGIGIDTAKFADSTGHGKIRKEFDIPNDRVVFLSVGELNANKNHSTAIKALSKIDCEFTYVIVGKGILEEELRKTAKEAGIENKMIFAGFRSDVADFYKNADCFVFPSFREGLSVSLMEAMASGMSIVCSRIRGNIDLVDEGKGGYLFDPHSEKELIDAVRRVLEADASAIKKYNAEKISGYDKRKVESIMAGIYMSKCSV